MATDFGVETAYTAGPIDYQPIGLRPEDSARLDLQQRREYLANLSPEERAALKAAALMIDPQTLPTIEAEVVQAKSKWRPEDLAPLPGRITRKFIAYQILEILKDRDGVYGQIVHSTSSDPHCIRRAAPMEVLRDWTSHPVAKAKIAEDPNLTREVEQFREALIEDRFDPTDTLVQRCRQLSTRIALFLYPKVQIPAELTT